MRPPSYTILLLVIILFPLIILFFIGLFRGLRRTYRLEKIPYRLVIVMAVCLFLWMTLTAVLSFKGFFSDYESMPPRIFLASIIPIFGFLLMLKSNVIKEVLKRVPRRWLVYIQVFRIPLELLMWLLYVENVIPPQMTFEGLNFDIGIGIIAPFLGYFCFELRQFSKYWVVFWNVIGIITILIITILAAISTPGPLRVFMNEPANALMSFWPYIWIPTVLAPFGILFHLLSIKQLLYRRKLS